MSGERKPMVRIATLWERESKAGRKYYSGFLGGAQLLMFRGEEITRDNGEVVQTWNLLVQEREQAPRQDAPRQALPERGQGTWDRSRDRERHAERGRAQAAGEAILQQRGRTPEPPQSWIDDSAEAIRDLTEGPGR
jgi:hypothetical protein